MTQPPLDIVRACQEKSSDVLNRSEDRLIAAVRKGIDAMAALLDKDSDPLNVQRVLTYLDVERSTAQQFDIAKDDSLRDIVYGLLVSLHVSLNEWNEERKQKKETGGISTQAGELSNFPPSFLIETKEEPIDIDLPQDYQASLTISASELMRDEKLIKEEELDNENYELIAADSNPTFRDTLAQPLNFNRYLPFNSLEDPTNISQVLPRNYSAVQYNTRRDEMEFKEEETPNDYMNSGMDDAVGDSLNEQPFNMDGSIHGRDTSDSVNEDKRKRSSRIVAKSVQYNDSMDDSDGDIGPSLKKRTKAVSMIKDDNKRIYFKGDDATEAVSKKVLVAKKNYTDLECPECEFRSLSVRSWVKHLSRKHSTTPALAGLALLCECGHESLSDKHSRVATPQCVICEIYPKTATGYAHHLSRHHQSTLVKNGIYLKCSCGVEVRFDSTYKHNQECNPRQFTLHQLDD